MQIKRKDDDIVSFHRNDSNDPNAFNLCVKLQGLMEVKNQLWNHLENLTFGCLVKGNNLKPAGTEPPNPRTRTATWSYIPALPVKPIKWLPILCQQLLYWMR